MRYISLCLALLCCTSHSLYCARYGLVIVPIADMVKAPLQTIWPHLDTDTAYAQIPYSLALGEDNPLDNEGACPRVQQFLFNTIVRITEECRDEVRVCSEHLFSIEDEPTIKRFCYWTHKRNIMPIDALTKYPSDLRTIPPPISFVNNEPIYTSNIVTLTLPFHDPVTNLTFSAGTRFVRAPQHTHAAHISIVLINSATLKAVTTHIPSAHCMVGTPRHEDAITSFVSLLKAWAHLCKKHAIPYVWGGNSIIHTLQPDAFERKRMILNGKRLDYFDRSDGNRTPKTGIDCSCIIARAAQICGMPYFYKDSITLAHHLDVLQPGESVEAGDIIWYPGHVVVISDVEKNLVVESRGYDHGFGIVHELSLRKSFAEIETVEELAQLQHNQLPLKRIDKDGNIVKVHENFKIVKIRSIWKRHNNYIGMS